MKLAYLVNRISSADLPATPKATIHYQSTVSSENGTDGFDESLRGGPTSLVVTGLLLAQ